LKNGALRGVPNHHFAFDRNGDITTASVPISASSARRRPGTPLPSDFQGAVVSHVAKIPARLMR
jgi:hypothetical protein